MGREAKITNKLTRKQVTFVKGIVSGHSATQAAMSAYNTVDPNVAKVIASQNLTKHNIKEAIDEALSSNGLSLDVVTSNIGHLANHIPEKISADVVLKSNIELLKLHNAYPDKKSTYLKVDVKARLAKLSFEDARTELDRLRVKSEEFVREADDLN